MNIFIFLKDLHTKLPDLTILDFFDYLNDLNDKVWNISKHDVLYVVSDWFHVRRLDNPVSLGLIVDFNMSNSKIKHPQSENDKIKPVDEIISFL